MGQFWTILNKDVAPGKIPKINKHITTFIPDSRVETLATSVSESFNF